MQNTIKATTLWLMSGYSVPLQTEHYAESVNLATTVCNQFDVDPDHQATEAWLDIDLSNLIAAVSYMHHYWHVHFNVCGADNGQPTHQFVSAAVQVPEQHQMVLKAIVNDISTIP